jgi:ATP-dependent DNA helicase RecG
MSKHDSQPHNPDIANAFFRAGYVETWGRGIERICEECAKHGIPNPEYTLRPEDVMVKFIGHKPPKAPKTQSETLDDTLGERLIRSILLNPKATQTELANGLSVSLISVKRTIKVLTESGVLTRKGGKRFGHWEVRQDRLIDKDEP